MQIDRTDFKQWMAARDLKAESLKDYLFYFDKFNVDHITQESVSEFIEVKYNNTISRAFIKNLLSYLIERKHQFRLDPEYLNNIRDIVLPKISGRAKIRLPYVVSMSEVIQIANQMKGVEWKRDRIMLFITYHCGLRIGELLGIRVSDFNWKEWSTNEKQMGELRVYGKGAKEGIAIVPPDIMLRIKLWINSKERSEHMIAQDKRLFPIIRRSWQLILENASIPLCKNTKGVKHVTPHMLRHSIASNMLKKGIDIKYIQEFLRHSSIMSTQVYLHLDKEELKKKYEEAFKDSQ